MSSQEQRAALQRKIWDIANDVRGSVDGWDFKQYVLGTLFYRFISENFAAYIEADDESIDYAALSDDVITDEIKDDAIKTKGYFIYPSQLFANVAKNANTNDSLNTDLAKIFAAIESSANGYPSEEDIKGLFADFDTTSTRLGNTVTEKNSRLAKVLKRVAELDFGDFHNSQIDLFGDAYEFLVKNFASDSGKKGGEFYTPPEVSRLLARILDPKPGDRICDPCCGSASLLIRAGEQVPEGENGVRDVALFGQELNGATWALAKMNMYLHGFDQARIERGDTIRSPKLVEDDQLMRFDVVVANPPFSLDKWGADGAESDRWQRFHRGVPPKSKGDYAFISHMIEAMNPVHGRVGVVVPHGVLFRGGAEAVIRRRLIKENLLDGVVGLPANLFYGVGIPAALLFFRRGKVDDSVFFIDASREFEKGKNQNRLRVEDMDRIVATWQAREDVARYARRATTADVMANDGNLNIPLYVDTFEAEEAVDLSAIQAEIGRLEAELASTRVQLSAALEELGL